MNNNEVEYAKKLLIDLDVKLNEVEEKIEDKKGLNIFDAVGMRTQEIKHSFFLAWLLNPAKKHALGGKFIKKFLDRLIAYGKISDKDLVLSNREILAASGVRSLDDLTDFIADEHLTIETEKVLLNIESRMDIYIESQATKTLLVIENKVFTSTHDNQLERYEKQFENYGDWRKIFVYLTPKGEIPQDNDEYRENWCVFSYQSLIQIINELLRELPRTKENTKLRLLLEDYTAMIDVNILNKNVELQKLCKQIIKEHKEAVDILMNYTDNAEEVVAYCVKRLKENVAGLTVVKESRFFFDFYTERLSKFFIEHGEDLRLDEKRVKCRYFLTQDGKIGAGICMDKDKSEVWSNAQLLIKEKFEPNKQLSNLFFSLKDYSEILVSENDRHLDFESIKPLLDERLKNYLIKLTAFEAELLNI